MYRWVLLVILLCFHIAASRAYAQSIAITPKNLEAPLQKQLVSDGSFFVNGPTTYGLTDEMRETYYPLGNTAKTVLSLTALRIAEAGLLDINEAVARQIPHILEENPFKAQLSMQHLLTETAGFAVPAKVNAQSPLKYYTQEIRTAGQIAQDDTIGWLVLVRLIEQVTNKSIDEAIYHYLLVPLNLPKNSFIISGTSDPSPFSLFGEMQANGEAIAEIIRVLIRNRDKTGQPFLKRYTHDFLIKHHSWRMHPLADARTLAGVQKHQNNHIWLEPAMDQGENGVFFRAYPEGDIAFIRFGYPTQLYKQAVNTVVENRFLPAKPDARPKEAEALVENTRFNGLYIRADKPSAWLRKRLELIRDDTLYLTDKGNNVIMIRDGTKETSYHRTAPFMFTSNSGETVFFSPYRQGGYMQFGDKVYRYIGPLGHETLVLTLVPFVLIILFSSRFYVRSSMDKPWQRMGQFGSIGTLVVTAAITLEYTLWPTVLYAWQMPWLIMVWRIAMNIGLALILSLPLFTLSFTRHNKMPAGKAILFAPLHLACLSVAAIMMFLILVAWGLAGEFSAY